MFILFNEYLYIMHLQLEIKKEIQVLNELKEAENNVVFDKSQYQAWYL